MTKSSPPPAAPTSAETVSHLTALALRMAQAVTEVTEAQQRTVAVAASWLPQPGAIGASAEDATCIGLGIDGAEEALAHAVPRIAILSLAFERMARAVRRGVALANRLEQGWPPPRGLSDDQRAMLLRQAARGVGEVIRTHTKGDAEAAERLFADLAARIDDPAFEQDLLERPVEELVQLLCREMGLTDADRPALPGRRHDPG